MLSPVLNGRTYFAAVSSGEDIDTELWTTDGTPEGTYRLKTFQSNFGSRNFAILNGKMYFTAQGGLWETNGTLRRTRVVQALDRISSGPLVRIGDELYFADAPGRRRQRAVEERRHRRRHAARRRLRRGDQHPRLAAGRDGRHGSFHRPH